MTIRPPLAADEALAPAKGDPVARYEAAVARLDALIQPASAPRDVAPSAIRVRAVHRLDRLRRFLAHLGDPHLAYPVVHVGGTSGKGSTAAAVAGILDAAGYRTGLHTSPYLQVATEKLQLGGRLIAGDAFADLVDEVLSSAEDWSARKPGEARLTYGEIWFAITARWFARERVDVAVIEVGAGGRFDLTNVVSPAVSVITSVGLDHTETLGGTIAEIAWHKAGIVKAGAPTVTAVADPVAFAAIDAEARAVGTTVERILPGVSFDVLEVGPGGTRWRERRSTGELGPVFRSALPGRFQAGNAATAVAAVRALAGHGLPVDEGALERGLRSGRLPGRTERMPQGTDPVVVLDGAHNPQKMAALLADLPAVLGRSPAPPPVVLVGALGGKDVAGMLRLLVTPASALVATSAAVAGKSSAEPMAIRAAAQALSFSGEVLVEPDPAAALDAALDLARARGAPVLATGSLYLVGAVRERWYPNAAIVGEQTPWPAGKTPSGRAEP